MEVQPGLVWVDFDVSTGFSMFNSRSKVISEDSIYIVVGNDIRFVKSTGHSMWNLRIIKKLFINEIWYLNLDFMYEFRQIDKFPILPLPSFGNLNIALPRCLLHLRSNGVLATDKISPLWLEKLLKGMYLSALICTKWSKSPDFPKT